MGKKEKYLKLQNGSDIRGVAMEGIDGENVNLDKNIASEIAGGFLLWLSSTGGKKPEDIRIAVGVDPRLTGDELKGGLSEGLLPFGVTVLDAGLASTPAMFMSTVFGKTKCDGAVMITASHLPFNRNGFKFFSKDGGLNKGDITEILETASDSETLTKKLAERNVDKSSGQCCCCGDGGGDGDGTVEITCCGKTVEVPASGKAGRVEKIDLMNIYCAHMRNVITDGINMGDMPLKGMKIVVDAGNGSGGFYAGEILEPLGADVSGSQFLEPDGRFPNHEPNPENRDAMRAICDAVKREGADLGLIFDTDVDRSAAVDSSGREIARNGIVAMAAALVSEDHPGTTVVTDSITSDHLTVFLQEKLGLRHFRFKRGYRNVINKAIELNEEGQDAQLAIETSGHAALKENFFLDDGAYLAAKIVIKAALLFREGKKIDSVTAELSEPSEAVEARIKVKCEDFGSLGDIILTELAQKVVMEKSFEVCASRFGAECALLAPGGEVACEAVVPNYEGIRIRFLKGGESFGWCLLRKSLHDPILPLNIESDIEGGAGLIAMCMYNFLKKYEDLDLEKLERIFLD